MKIVHCLFTIATGGAQVLAVGLINEMCKHHDVFLVIINKSSNTGLLQQLDSKVRVYNINRTEGSKNPIPLIKLNFLLFKLKPDIIHCHEPRAALVIKVTGPGKLYTIHDVGIPTTHYHLYDRIVAISDAVYEDVAPKYSDPIGKVYNGIPIDLFKHRTNYNLKREMPLRFVQVSRLMHEKKGQDVLLHALHQLHSRNPDLNFTLDFIGTGDSIEYLKKMAVDLGLAGKVSFPGDRSRKWLFENLSDYHILIQPSRYEGFGLTILEGFAAGLPVLASDIDGPAEIIAHSPGGFLFKNGDSDGCSMMLERIIEMYFSNQVKVMMEKTRQVMQQKYSIQACANGYLNEYSLLTTVNSVSA